MSDIVNELRSRDRWYTFRLGSQNMQRETVEWRAAEEIERLRIIERRAAEIAGPTDIYGHTATAHWILTGEQYERPPAELRSCERCGGSGQAIQSLSNDPKERMPCNLCRATGFRDASIPIDNTEPH